MTNRKPSPLRTIARVTCLALALVAVVLWERGRAERAPDAAIPRITLTNVAPDEETLARQFLQALAAGDRAAVERLRVDENEYRALIIPGSVKPGQPPQIMPDDSSHYFWRHHNTVNLYTVTGLLRSYGGKTYRLDRIEGPAPEAFAWYTVHRGRVLYARDENDEEIELRLGSVAEHGGGFKFISYHSD